MEAIAAGLAAKAIEIPFPYVKEGFEKCSGDVCKAAAEKDRGLLDTIKARLARDKVASDNASGQEHDRRVRRPNQRARRDFLLKDDGETEDEQPNQPFKDSKDFSEEDAKAFDRYQEAIQHGKMVSDLCESIKKAEMQFEDVVNRVKVTFWSILIINLILVGMGVVMFAGAFYGALGGKFEITAVLTATGFGNILTVFAFSMDRVQTSLGDQVQVQIAYNGFMKQILKFDEHFKFEIGTEQIKEINEEIRKLTLTSMEYIQRFTEIGRQSAKEPWINPFPIRYGKLEIPTQVYVGERITIRGTLKNESDRPITVTSIVIAVRPPLGTPTGGPFTYDFTVQPGRKINPNELIPITHTKSIEANWDPQKTNPRIPQEYIDKEWYAFMTCQTEDGNWHDDPNKYTFRVSQRTKPQTNP